MIVDADIYSPLRENADISHTTIERAITELAAPWKQPEEWQDVVFKESASTSAFEVRFMASSASGHCQF